MWGSVLLPIKTCLHSNTDRNPLATQKRQCHDSNSQSAARRHQSSITGTRPSAPPNHQALALCPNVSLSGHILVQGTSPPYEKPRNRQYELCALEISDATLNMCASHVEPCVLQNLVYLSHAAMQQRLTLIIPRLYFVSCIGQLLGAVRYGVATVGGAALRSRPACVKRHTFESSHAACCQVLTAGTSRESEPASRQQPAAQWVGQHLAS